MTRRDKYDRDIWAVLHALLGRPVQDRELAKALGKATSTFSRHKENGGFPTYEELDAIGAYFECSPRVLQIAFQLIGEDSAMLLDGDEMTQYIQIGGGVAPLVMASRRGVTTVAKPAKLVELRPRPDSPPL